MSARNAADGARQVTLDVSLLGRDYKFACRESERADLIEAVAFLDRRMRDIRETGKVAGAERIAVMAALNIAHEMQRAKRDQGTAAAAAQPASTARADAAEIFVDDAPLRRRIVSMQATIDEVLAGADKTS
jgi:cell division protein ZapA